MARAGRTYHRDARGRFASGGSAGGAKTIRRGAKKPGGGTAPARAKLRGAMARQAEAPSPQRKGAVTRAKKALRAAKVPVRMAIAGRPPRIAKGDRRRRPGQAASTAANSIRPSRLKGRGARNSIRPVTLGSTGRGLRGDRARAAGARSAAVQRLARLAQNYKQAKQAERSSRGKKAKAKAVRSQRTARAALAWYQRPRTAVVPYRPVTLRGRMKQIDRQINRTMKDAADAVRGLGAAIRKHRPMLDRMQWQVQRMNADAVAKRLSSRRIDREIAGIELGIVGGRSGAKAIQRRMERAAAAAARGSKPAARARVIYGNQLAAMGTGKPAKGRNNLRPGPRNTQGPPKKRRRKRKP